MSAGHIVAIALLVVGCGAVLLSAVALVVVPDTYDRVHALTPASTIGAPCVTVALAIANGPGREAVKLVLIGVAIALGGVVVAMATGRASAQRDGELDAESPR